MAGILQRFKDIMSSNINALLDKAEDPAKMIDQYLRNLESDLGKVKAETAAVMAEETRSRRMLDECTQEMDKLTEYAKKAVAAGNDNDAREFLNQKQKQADKVNSLTQAYQQAADNAAKMRSMHDKLVKDIQDLNSRRDAIKAKVAVAKTQQNINKINGSMNGAAESLSAFDRMEAKADKMLDEANAMSALNQVAVENSVDSLKDKYDSEPSSAVDDELAALKAELGK